MLPNQASRLFYKRTDSTVPLSAYDLVRVIRLWDAAEDELRDRIHKMLEGLNPSAQVAAVTGSVNGETPLLSASRKGYAVIAKLLIDTGAHADIFDNTNETPLIAAIERKCTTVIDVLLKSKENLANPEYGTLPLIRAIEVDSVEIVEKLLSAGADINVIDEEGNTILAFASRLERVDIVQRLLQRNVVADTVSLACAASKGNAFLVTLLLDRGARINPIQDEPAPLTSSAYSGHVNIVRLLLDRGAHIDHEDTNGCTALAAAVESNCMEVVQCLLKHGADVMNGFAAIHRKSEAEVLLLLLSALKELGINNVDEEGTPVLALVAQRGSGELVQLVISAGAEIEMTDADGNTPLLCAAMEGNHSSVEALLNAGAYPNAEDVNGWTSLHHAIANRDATLTYILIEGGADVNGPPLEGQSPLFLAVRRQHKETVDLLLRHDPCPYLDDRDEEGRTPLSYAVNKANTGIVKALLQAGADAKEADYLGITPLHIAVERGYKDVVKLLLEYGADVDEPADDGTTPLGMAALDDTMEMIFLLVARLANTDNSDKVKTHDKLKNLLEDAIRKGKMETVTALAIPIMSSHRDLAFDPNIWDMDESNGAKTGHYPMPNNIKKAARISLRSSFSQNSTKLPGNILVWAISRDCHALLRILLDPKEEDISEEERLWRYDLCFLKTCVGTPLSLAVAKANPHALILLLQFLKGAWGYRQVGTAAQKRKHPLDAMDIHDFIGIIMKYPNLAAHFLKEVGVVKAYSFVHAHIDRVPIKEGCIWVCATRERSPPNIWKTYVEHCGDLSNLELPEHTKIEVPVRTHRKRRTTSNNSGIFKNLLSPVPDRRNGQWSFSGPRSQNISRLNSSWAIRGGNCLEDGSNFADSNANTEQKDKKEDENKATKKKTILSERYKHFIFHRRAEKEVATFMLPLQCIASYPVLRACVKVSQKLGDSSLFTSTGMAAAVQLHWELYARKAHTLSLVRYAALLLIFILTTVYFRVWAGDSMTLLVVAWLLQVFKLALTVSFMKHEWLQLQHEDGKLGAYLKDPWNWIDISAYVLLFVGVGIEAILEVYRRISHTDITSVNALDSIIALLLWFKLLYFMRPFRSSGPMVYMIFQIIADIKIFLVILVVVVVGFANAFFAILGGVQDVEYNACHDDPLNDEKCLVPGVFSTPFLALRSSFAYMLGNFDFNDLDHEPSTLLISLLWALFMVVVTIVLLNILIAIISESYCRISETKIPAWRLEQARVVVNMYASLSEVEKNKWHAFLVNHPWLQVLVLKNSMDEVDTLPDMVAEFEKLTKHIEAIGDASLKRHEESCALLTGVAEAQAKLRKEHHDLQRKMGQLVSKVATIPAVGDEVRKIDLYGRLDSNEDEGCKLS